MLPDKYLNNNETEVWQMGTGWVCLINTSGSVGVTSFGVNTQLRDRWSGGRDYRWPCTITQEAFSLIYSKVDLKGITLSWEVSEIPSEIAGKNSAKTWLVEMDLHNTKVSVGSEWLLPKLTSHPTLGGLSPKTPNWTKNTEPWGTLCRTSPSLSKTYGCHYPMVNFSSPSTQ